MNMQHEEGWSMPYGMGELDELGGLFDPDPAYSADVQSAEVTPRSDRQFADYVAQDDGSVDYTASPQFHRDVAMLNRIGYAAPDTDPNDPAVRATVQAFQGDVGIKVDGWIGPQTRAAMVQVAARQAQAEPIAPAPVNPGPAPAPAPLPAPLSLPEPAPLPAAPSGAATPAATGPAKMKPATIAVIAIGALALLGVAYYAAGKD